MEFTSRAICLLVSSALNLILAALLTWKHRSRKVVRIFSITLFFISGYCWLSAGLAAETTQAHALLWLRIFMPVAYVLVALIFHVSILFSRTDNSWSRAYLRFAYAMAILLSAAKFLNFSNGASYRHGHGWFPANDPVFYFIYAPFLFCTLALGIALVTYRMFKTPSEVERNRLGFFVLGTGLALALDLMILFPKLDFLAPFSTLAFSLTLAYAIIRHRLLDLSLVVRKGTLAAVLSFVVVVALVAMVFEFQELVMIRELGFGFFPIVSTALLVVLLILLLWFQISKGMSRLMGVQIQGVERRLADYTTLLGGQFSSDYLTAVLSRLRQDFGISKSCLLVKDLFQGRYLCAASCGVGASSYSLALDSMLVVELQRAPRILDSHELFGVFEEETEYLLDARMRSELSKEMSRLNVCVALPLVVNRRLEAVLLLGDKDSESAYSGKDLEFLQALSGQMAAALESSRLYRQVQHADRLGTLGTLSSSFAHELRNPLTAISDFVALMPARHSDERFRDKFNQIVGAELEKMIKLTDQLLTISRPSQGQEMPLRLADLCAGASGLLSVPYAKKGVSLKTEGSQGQGEVYGIESELSQVLINLLLNALQATEKGGQVILTITEGADHVCLSVMDSGCGMSQEQLRHVFEPFYTTKKGGTGLGLATSARVIQQHRGEITVTSTVGQGSCFILRLPRLHH